jgi:beta-lactamase class A
MQLAAALAVALVPVLTAFAAPPEPPDPLRARLAEVAERADGVVGVAVVDVVTGRSVALNPEERFPMASTYKVPIALAVLHRADQGPLLLSERLEVKSSDLVEGGMETILKKWRPGLSLTVRELVDLMVTESDNTATDLLFRRLGGPPAVAARLTELGLSGIDVSRTERESAADAYGVRLPSAPIGLETFRRLRRAVPAAERRKARERWEKDARDTATPVAMGRLLVRLAKGELLKKESTDLLLDALRRCKTGDKRIRALLPAGTTVYDKTGTAARSTNDVGLVRLPSGGLVAIAVFVKASDKPQEVRERAIAEIARAAYESLAAPAGRGGAARAASVMTRRRSGSV